MASMSKPTYEISVEEGKITIAMNAGFTKKHDTFKLGEEFDTEFQGQKVKALTTYENGVITSSNKAEDPNVKTTKTTREILDNGQLLMTVFIGDVVCKRWFTKVEK